MIYVTDITGRQDESCTFDYGDPPFATSSSRNIPSQGSGIFGVETRDLTKAAEVIIFNFDRHLKFAGMYDDY